MTIRPHHPGYRDMVGVRVASVVVVRRAANEGNGCAAWFVQCPKGHEFVVRGVHLRHAMKKRADVLCRECDPKHFSRRKFIPAVEYSPTTSKVHYLTCSICNDSGHTRANCPQRIGKKAKFCDECSGLAHRRPLEGCPVCKGPFMERAPTLADAMALPNHNRREIA